MREALDRAQTAIEAAEIAARAVAAGYAAHNEIDLERQVGDLYDAVVALVGAMKEVITALDRLEEQ